VQTLHHQNISLAVCIGEDLGREEDLDQGMPTLAGSLDGSSPVPCLATNEKHRSCHVLPLTHDQADIWKDTF